MAVLCLELILTGRGAPHPSGRAPGCWWSLLHRNSSCGHSGRQCDLSGQEVLNWIRWHLPNLSVTSHFLMAGLNTSHRVRLSVRNCTKLWRASRRVGSRTRWDGWSRSIRIEVCCSRIHSCGLIIAVTCSSVASTVFFSYPPGLSVAVCHRTKWPWSVVQFNLLSGSISHSSNFM